MIKVVNGYKHRTFQSDDTVYIGRGGRGLQASPLANPNPLISEEDRQNNLQRYRVWLWHRLHDQNSAQLAEIKRIKTLEKRVGTVHLACFCKPKDCHGDIIKGAIECGAYC